MARNGGALSTFGASSATDRRRVAASQGQSHKSEARPKIKNTGRQLS
jgi:hypothetical protein